MVRPWLEHRSRQLSREAPPPSRWCERRRFGSVHWECLDRGEVTFLPCLLSKKHGKSGTADGTMDQRKLKKLRRRLEAFRAQGGVSSKPVVKLAKALGCERDSRGKEPTYVNKQLPGLFPISIPDRKDLAPGTKANILDALEIHIHTWEAKLEREKASSNGQKGRNGHA